MKKRQAWPFLLPVLTLALLAAGCAGKEDRLANVRFALLSPGVTNVHVELAVEKGIFAKHGIALDIRHFLTGGPEALAAVAGGDVDMGIFGSPVIVGISKGVPIKDVAAPVEKEVDFQLVAVPGIETVEDLKGKTIVTGAAGSGPHVAIRKILAAHHIEESEVNIVNSGGADMRMVIESGQVAAVVASEPIVSQIVLEGKGRVLVRAADVYGKYQHSHFFATTKLIEERPDVVRNVVQAYAEAVRYAKRHPDELIDYAEERLGLDRDLLKSYYDGHLPNWDEKLKVDVEGLLGAVALLQETGDIDPGFQPAIEDLYDDRFAPE